MNLRFELEGIASSMPTLKRGRRLGCCMGTDEAVPSPGGSWVAGSEPAVSERVDSPQALCGVCLNLRGRPNETHSTT